MDIADARYSIAAVGYRGLPSTLRKPGALNLHIDILSKRGLSEWSKCLKIQGFAAVRIETGSARAARLALARAAPLF